MKYELIPEGKFFRVRALIDFGNVKAGDYGGQIEKQSNLAQEGLCWVSQKARIEEDAVVFGDAQIYERAIVSGRARVYSNASVYGYAHIFEDGMVCDNAHVFGNSRVFENGEVSGEARISGRAVVAGKARISGTTSIDGNVWMPFRQPIFDNSIESIIAASCNLLVEDGWVHGYKRVNEDMTSEFDSSFQYTEGWNETIANPDPSLSCAEGLHFSHYSYYPKKEGSKIIRVACKLEDIVCCLEGKIRCSKLFVHNFKPE